MVDHLRKLIDFGEMVFYWPHHEPPCGLTLRGSRKQGGFICTATRSTITRQPATATGSTTFVGPSTVNAETMSADALQALMRHKSYSTTQRYINLANQVNRAVEGLHVPDVLKKVN